MKTFAPIRSSFHTPLRSIAPLLTACNVDGAARFHTPRQLGAHGLASEAIIQVTSPAHVDGSSWCTHLDMRGLDPQSAAASFSRAADC